MNSDQKPTARLEEIRERHIDLTEAARESGYSSWREMFAAHPEFDDWELLDLIDRELPTLLSLVERLSTAGTHTCHAECQRVECVLRRRVAELELKLEQHRGALGYAVPGDTPMDPDIKCGICEANRPALARISRLEAALRTTSTMDVEFILRDGRVRGVLNRLKNEARTALAGEDGEC